jgi:hypothetical protein
MRPHLLVDMVVNHRLIIIDRPTTPNSVDMGSDGRHLGLRLSALSLRASNRAGEAAGSEGASLPHLEVDHDRGERETAGGAEIQP